MQHLPIYSTLYKDLLSGYLTWLEITGYTAGVRKRMLSVVREFFYRLELTGIFNLTEILPGVIEGHYRYLQGRPNERHPGGISASHVNFHMYSLKTFMGYLEKTLQVERNPFSALSFPKALYNPRRVVSRDDISSLYGVSESYRDRSMLSLFYGCGLRREEVVTLEMGDVRPESLLLYVRSGKGRKRRVVPLSEAVAGDFKNYLVYERNFYLDGDRKNMQGFIINNHGSRVTGLWLWRRFKYLASLAGLPSRISLHHLRHSIATHLLEGGLPIEQVRDFLGHTFLETTEIYTRVSARYLNSAI